MAYYVLLLETIVHAAAPPFVIAAYVPDYRYDGLRARRAWTTSRATDLMLFSAEPTASGGLSGVSKLVPEWLLDPAGDDAVSAPFTAPLREEGESMRTFMRRRKHARREQAAETVAARRSARVVRLLLTVGGAGRSSSFAPMARDPAARARFVGAVVDACEAHGLDGVDVDWEDRWSAADVANLGALLGELKIALAPLSALLTIALHPWQDIGSAGFAAVDRVHLMAYDAPPAASSDGRHTSVDLAKSMVDSLRTQWERHGTAGDAAALRLDKIVLGIPAYARPMPAAVAAGHFAAGEVVAYADVVARSVGSAAAGGSSAVEVGGGVFRGCAFDSVSAVLEKTRWAREQGLGGVFLWEAGMDTVERATSLLNAVATAAAPAGREL